MNDEDNFSLNHLSPHTKLLFVKENEPHINDWAAFSARSYRCGDWTATSYVDAWQKINESVIQLYGEKDIRTTRAAIQLADTYFRDGRKSEAIAVEESVVVKRRNILGSSALEALEAIGNLARSLRDVNRLDEAESLEKEVLQHCIESMGLVHAVTAQAQEDLASTYQSQRRHTEAIALLKKALKTRKILYTPRHPRILQVMVMLETSYENQGQKELAERMRQEMLKIKTTPQGTLDNLGLIEVMCRLAKLYFSKEQYSKSETWRRQELEGRMKLQGNHHPSTLYAMYRLGVTYLIQGRHTEAEKLLVEVSEEYRNIYHPLHPYTLSSMFSLALTYCKQARFTKAEKLWVETLEGCKAIRRPHHPDILNLMNALAYTYLELNRFTEAESQCLEALKGCKDVYGPRHSRTLHSVELLACTYFWQSRYTEAENLWTEVSEAYKDIHGPRHSKTLNSMTWLGSVYCKQDRYGDAEKLLLEALEGCRDIYDPHHAGTLASMDFLAHTYFKQGRLTEAEKLWIEELEMYEDIHGPRHPETINTMNCLAVIYSEQGDLAKAARLRKELAKRTKEGLESEQAETVHT